MRAALVLLPLLVCCSDYDLAPISDDDNYAADIKVDPAVVSFGQVEVGSTATETFTISNVGNAQLMVEQMELMDVGVFSITQMNAALGPLEPEESVDVVVEYTPTEADSEDVGSVLISSTDPYDPMIEVELWGGVDMPILTITPDPADFGSVLEGIADTMTLTLTSTGQSAVTFSDFEISGTAFSATADEAWPMTLEPGYMTTMEVTVLADATGTISETITVDVDEPGIDATATLRATVAEGGPIAVCSVDPVEVQPNRDTATWMGRESYDTDGYNITSWDWTLHSQPGGSTAFMPPGGADRSGFAPDLAGEYVGELIVTNELGVESDPCYATLTATPIENLWIQMYWSHTNDDMDLHLLEPGGRTETNGDCYFANCVGGNLDWGVSGDSSDDPSLDMDDIPGTGPENINIDYPESGNFTVLVHDYPGSTYNGGDDVTVVIFLGGKQVWTDTRTISGENTYTDFADIEWPSGYITSL